MDGVTLGDEQPTLRRPRVLFGGTGGSAHSHSVFLSVFDSENNRPARTLRKAKARHDEAFAILSLHLKTWWDFSAVLRPNSVSKPAQGWDAFWRPRICYSSRAYPFYPSMKNPLTLRYILMIMKGYE